MNRLHQLLSQSKGVRLYEKDLLTGALYLDGHLVGLSVPRTGEQVAGKVWLKGLQFPAASERVAPCPRREAVTRRGDTSCRGVVGSCSGKCADPSPLGEPSGEGH